MRHTRKRTKKQESSILASLVRLRRLLPLLLFLSLFFLSVSFVCSLSVETGETATATATTAADVSSSSSSSSSSTAKDEKHQHDEDPSPSSSTTSSPSSTSASSLDSLMLLCTADGQLYALDAWTGRLSSQISTNALLRRSSSSSSFEEEEEEDDDVGDADDTAFDTREEEARTTTAEAQQEEAQGECPLASEPPNNDNDNDLATIINQHGECGAAAAEPAVDKAADAPSSSSFSSAETRAAKEQRSISSSTSSTMAPILPGLDGRLYYWRKKPARKHDTKSTTQEGEDEEEEVIEDDDDDDMDVEEELQALPLTIEGLLDHPVQSCEEEEGDDKECGILTATMETSLLAVNERGQLLWSDTTATTTTTTPLSEKDKDDGNNKDDNKQQQQQTQSDTNTGTTGRQLVLQRKDYHVKHISTATGQQMWNVTLGVWQALDFSGSSSSSDEAPQQAEDTTSTNEDSLLSIQRRVQDKRETLAEQGGDRDFGGEPGDTNNKYWWEQQEQEQHQLSTSPFMMMPSVVFSTGKVVFAVHPTTHAVLWKLETSSAVASVFGIHKGRWKSLEVLSESDLSTSALASTSTSSSLPMMGEEEEEGFADSSSINPLLLKYTLPVQQHQQQDQQAAVAVVDYRKDKRSPYRHPSLYGSPHQRYPYHDYQRLQQQQHRQGGQASSGVQHYDGAMALLPAPSPRQSIDYNEEDMMRMMRMMEMCPPGGGGGGDPLLCPNLHNSQLRLPSPTSTTTAKTSSKNIGGVWQPEGLLLSWRVIAFVLVLVCTALAVGGRLWYTHKKRAWMVMAQQQQITSGNGNIAPPPPPPLSPKTTPTYMKSHSSLEGRPTALLETTESTPPSSASPILSMRRCLSLPDHAEAVAAVTSRQQFRNKKRLVWKDDTHHSNSNREDDYEEGVVLGDETPNNNNNANINTNATTTSRSSSILLRAQQRLHEEEGYNNDGMGKVPTAAAAAPASSSAVAGASATTTMTALSTTALPIASLLGDGEASTETAMMITNSNIPLVRYSRYASEYKEVGPLGKGGFGSVFKCQNVLDGRDYAIKKVYIRGGGNRSSLDDDSGFEQRLERTLREVKILAVLDHPNIVRYFGAWLEIEKQDQQQPQHDSTGADDESNALSRCYSSSMITESVSQWPARPHHHHHRHNNQRNVGYSMSEDSSSSYVPRRFQPPPPVYNAPRRLAMEDYGFIFEGSEEEEEANNNSNSNKVRNSSKGEGTRQPNEASSSRRSSHVASDRTSATVPLPRDSGSKPDSLAERNKIDPSSASTAVPPTPRPSTAMRHTLYIQMQLCSQKTVGDFLSNSKARQGSADNGGGVGGVDIPLALRLFQQIAQAVRYVHEQGLIHRDLKPQNCFMDDSGNVKVGDFGLSRESADATSKYGDGVIEPLSMSSSTMFSAAAGGGGGDDHTAGVGTRAYASPEQMNGSDYDSSTDVFSLGIMLFELLYPMYTGMERNICLSQLRQQLAFPDDWDETVGHTCPTLREMVYSMVARDPSARPTAGSVAQHIQSILNEFTIVSLDDNFRLLQGPDVILLRVEAEHRPDALFQTIQAIEESAEESNHAVQVVQYGLRSSHHYGHQQPAAIMEFALKFTGTGSQLVALLLQRPGILKVRQVSTNNHHHRTIPSSSNQKSSS